jgi:tetratricopeptide (TPR) repeat protein
VWSGGRDSNFQEISFEGKNYQMVYYFKNPIANIDSLIAYYKSQKISYFKYFVLATCYGLQNDFNKAQEFFNKSIALNPKFAYSYANRAFFNSKLNDYLIEIDARSSQTLSIDGKTDFNSQVSQQLPMVDENQIIKDLNTAIQFSDELMIQYNLGNAYAIKQNFIDAIYWYNKSLQNADDLKWVLFNKALIQIRLNDHKTACKNLSKAGELGLEDAYPIIRKFCKD